MSDNREDEPVGQMSPAFPERPQQPRELTSDEEESLREEAGALSLWAKRKLDEAKGCQGE